MTGLGEAITWKGETIAYVMRSDASVEQTTFVTPPSAELQLGLVARQEGESVPRHTHRPVERRVVGTAEVLVVRRGHCQIELFAADHQAVTTLDLETGDVILLLRGGHGLRMMEDTVLLEVKQGPFLAEADKEPF